jgi:hypothetical protein
LDARADNKCYFNGKELAENEKIDDNLLGDACVSSPTCTTNGKFIYAQRDCAEYFGPPLLPECRRMYAKDKCCSVGTVCGKREKKLKFMQIIFTFEQIFM